MALVSNRVSEVTIVGCGVSGLTCGIRLLDKGFNVTIRASELPPRTTSDTAAAVWYPYGVEEKVRKWSDATFKEFYRLSKDVPAAGVSLVQFVDLFVEEKGDPWWKDTVPGFRHTLPEELPSGLEYTHGYTIETPLIETTTYLNYLMSCFYEVGGQIKKEEVGALRDLHQDHRLIVNCSGVWARNLADDKGVYPSRGQILRVTKPPNLRRCLMDEKGPRGLAYIVPRSTDCILGGTAENDRWSLDADFHTSQEILRKCIELEPSLREAKVLEQRVGLRPAHKHGVQLKLEQVNGLDHCGIIHNYGHAGAGFTLSWGCANEVARIAEDFRNNA